jgi:hypothetical protein
MNRLPICSLLIAVAMPLACRPAVHDPQVVPECRALDEALRACSGEPSALSEQLAAMARTETEERRLAALCIENAARVRRSCR